MTKKQQLCGTKAMKHWVVHPIHAHADGCGNVSATSTSLTAYELHNYTMDSWHSRRYYTCHSENGTVSAQSTVITHQM